jgi:hypothetical protein
MIDGTRIERIGHGFLRIFSRFVIPYYYKIMNICFKNPCPIHSIRVPLSRQNNQVNVVGRQFIK